MAAVHAAGCRRTAETPQHHTSPWTSWNPLWWNRSPQPWRKVLHTSAIPLAAPTPISLCKYHWCSFTSGDVHFETVFAALKKKYIESVWAFVLYVGWFDTWRKYVCVCVCVCMHVWYVWLNVCACECVGLCVCVCVCVCCICICMFQCWASVPLCTAPLPVCTVYIVPLNTEHVTWSILVLETTDLLYVECILWCFGSWVWNYPVMCDVYTGLWWFTGCSIAL